MFSFCRGVLLGVCGREGLASVCAHACTPHIIGTAYIDDDSYLGWTIVCVVCFAGGRGDSARPAPASAKPKKQKEKEPRLLLFVAVFTVACL